MELVKLGDIVDYIKGNAFSSKLYQDHGVRIVRVTDFGDDTIIDDEPIYIDKDNKYKNFELFEGDILVQTVGSWENNPKSIVGKVVRVPESCNGSYLNQNIVKLIPKKLIDKAYLFYALKANKFSKYCVMRGQGAANQASVTLKTIFKFNFNCHKLDIQTKLSTIFSNYDKLIKNNYKRIKILEKLAEEIYKERFIRFRFPGYENYKFENGIPVGWTIETIGSNFKSVLGGTPSREKNEYWKNGTIPWINSGEVNKNQVNKASEYITKIGYSRSSTELLPINSTLVAITGATLGQVSINEIEVCTNQSVVGVYDEEGIYSFYIFYTIKTYINDISNRASGGAQQHINKDIINNYKIVIPDIKITNKFKSILDPIYKEIKDINRENDILIEQRDLLLPRLMSGKLEVK